MANKIFFRINISPPLTTINGLEGSDPWLGLPGHQTSTSMHLFLWGYMKALISMSPVDSEEARIARILVTAAIWLFERLR